MKNKIIKLNINKPYIHQSLLDSDIFKIVKNNADIKIYTMLERPDESNEAMIDLSRYDDIKLLDELITNSINTPKYIDVDDEIVMVQNMNNLDNYVLKVRLQARSMGKMIVNKFQLSKLLNEINSCENYQVFNNKFNIDTGDTVSDFEEETLYNALIKGPHRYYLSKMINFNDEYRVLYHRGVNINDYIIEHRSGYAPNSKSKRQHTVISINDIKSYRNININKIFKQLKKFGDALNLPSVSMDLYICADGTWGLFEHSVQFGIKYDECTLQKLSKQMTIGMCHSVLETPNLGEKVKKRAKKYIDKYRDLI